MASVSFDECTPGSVTCTFSEPRPPTNFSYLYGAPTMGITTRMKGLLVKGVYGDNVKQADLREQYSLQLKAGDVKEKLISYCNPICDDQAKALREWAAQWQQEAESNAKSTVNGRKGSRMKYSPLLRDDGAFKINVPSDVAEACASEADVSDVFDLGHGVYEMVFKISGIWRNNQNFGYSLTALRIKRVKQIESNKRKAPAEFETVHSKWNFDASVADEDSSV